MLVAYPYDQLPVMSPTAYPVQAEEPESSTATARTTAFRPKAGKHGLSRCGPDELDRRFASVEEYGVYDVDTVRELCFVACVVVL